MFDQILLDKPVPRVDSASLGSYGSSAQPAAIGYDCLVTSLGSQKSRYFVCVYLLLICFPFSNIPEEIIFNDG